MDLKQTIIDMMHEVAELTESEIIGNLSDNTLLLESGLDSLGFAILVARLEEELNYDPFTQMEDAVYPSTLGEFHAIYEKLRKKHDSVRIRQLS